MRTRNDILERIFFLGKIIGFGSTYEKNDVNFRAFGYNWGQYSLELVIYEHILFVHIVTMTPLVS